MRGNEELGSFREILDLFENKIVNLTPVIL